MGAGWGGNPTNGGAIGSLTSPSLTFLFVTTEMESNVFTGVNCVARPLHTQLLLGARGD